MALSRDEIREGLSDILEEVAGVNPDEVANLKTVGDAVSFIEKG